MGRGIILGMGWGLLVASVATVTLSLVYSNDNRAPVAHDPKVDVAAPKTAADETAAPAIGALEAPSRGDLGGQGGEAEQGLADEARVPDTDTAKLATPTPAAPEMAQTDAPPAHRDADTDKAPTVMIPEGQGADSAMATDDAVDTAPAMAADDPVQTGDSAQMPKAPATEAQPAPETQTKAMTAPEMQEGPVATYGAADEATTEAQTAANAPKVQLQDLPKTLAPDQAQSPQQDAKLPDVVPAPELPVDLPVDPATDPATDPAMQPPEPKPLAPVGTTREPVPKMANLAPNVKTNRLPTIGGPAETLKVSQQETAPEPDPRALVAYAMEFENPGSKPLFSVVLIDDAQYPLSDEVLSHLPFALSFAIDAVRDDAHAVAARYRAAGFEVLMLTNLPFGANATDIEVAFGAYSRAIPEAIGVLDLGANGFLRGPSTATQIAGIMSDQGYGLITPSKGLNSAQKAAKREGVPAVLVFRGLDEEAEKPSVIRRYLDRAAFRAAQEGSVIMLGHTRPDTIEALVTWALEDRAASVAIAPVSAIMLAQ